MEEYGFTQEQAAARVGRSRPAVANALRLLNLPEAILTMVEEGSVSAGHARALVSVEDEALALELAKKVRAEAISVREIERLAKKAKKPAAEPVKAQPNAWGNHYYKELELALGQTMSRRVKIHHTADGKGRLEIDFFDREDLAALAALLAPPEAKQEEK